MQNKDFKKSILQHTLHREGGRAWIRYVYFSPLSVSVSLEVITTVVPTLFDTRDQFREEFSHRPGVGVGSWGGDGFVMIQAHYTYCAFYF